ncbi:MAG: hypothetical protein N4A68_19565 [Maledivibacter sp.]|jgi:hypothetical protein|nr:hypothetical protein [Maledivibacter sp.]
MNRWRFVWMSVLIVLIAYGIFAFPITINKEIPAVKYRLGDEESIENITIKIDGQYNRKLFLSDTFIGTIYIEGYEFTKDDSGFSNLKSTLADINFNRDGYGRYGYVKVNSDDLMNLMEGEIFMKDKFSMFTMTIMEKDASDKSRSGWSSEKGLMISAPAKTRGDALNISNLLMKDFLREHSLQ